MPDSFGLLLRRIREGRLIGLREAARAIGVSPTYLSMVERDAATPPTEDKVKALAHLFEVDEDELLAAAGKISTDLTDLIRRHPREMAMLIRTTRQLTASQISKAINALSRKRPL